MRAIRLDRDERTLDNPEIREEVDRRVREHYGIVDGVKEAEASDDAKQAKAKKKADTEE